MNAFSGRIKPTLIIAEKDQYGKVIFTDPLFTDPLIILAACLQMKLIIDLVWSFFSFLLGCSVIWFGLVLGDSYR